MHGLRGSDWRRGRLDIAQSAAQRGGQSQWYRWALAYQSVKLLAVESQDFTLALGAHSCRSRLVGQQGHLADDVALTTRAHALFARAFRPGREHPEMAAADDVHGVADVAHAHDVFTVVEANYLQAGGQLGQGHAVEPSKQEVASQQFAMLLDEAAAAADSARSHV